MPTVTLEEAQARLPELIESLSDRDSIVITKNTKPSAQIFRFDVNRNDSIVPEIVNPGREIKAADRKPGECSHMLISYIDDDEHLKDFEEYM